MLLMPYLASQDGSVFDDAGRMDLNVDEHICNSYYSPQSIFFKFCLVCILKHTHTTQADRDDGSLGDEKAV